ncbi:MAG: PadR family transcriptional regulator [Actinomycetota bacterium]|nr:PadR family transcriptional regulator [Actinomycetota bacterium]
MAPHDPQMLKGVLRLLVLTLLEAEEDYGYALVVRLRELGFDDLAEGTVYPALARMESAGLLEGRLVRSSSGPARKYYRVTDAGHAERERAETDWRSLASTVDRALDDREPTTTAPPEPTEVAQR